MTVSYNHLNLPRRVVFDAYTNTIDLSYDAAGVKLSKLTIDNHTGANDAEHHYVAGIEYRNGALEAIYNSEGRLTPNGAAFYYEYSLRDHLGNSRISFRANGSSAQVLQENHYYPFGMEMQGAWAPQLGVENRYQYNDAVFLNYMRIPVDGGPTWDIDVHKSLKIATSELDNGNQLLSITGQISGDRFIQLLIWHPRIKII